MFKTISIDEVWELIQSFTHIVNEKDDKRFSRIHNLDANNLLDLLSEHYITKDSTESEMVRNINLYFCNHPTPAGKYGNLKNWSIWWHFLAEPNEQEQIAMKAVNYR